MKLKKNFFIADQNCHSDLDLRCRVERVPYYLIYVTSLCITNSDRYLN